MTKVNTVIEVRKNQYVVEFLCDYCHRHTLERKSHFDKKKNHFCRGGLRWAYNFGGEE